MAKKQTKAATQLEDLQSETIQERGRKTEGEALAHTLLIFMARAGQLIAPWWSKQRDADLRAFWRTVDYLAGAVYTMESRLSTVPWRIRPKDMSIKAHHKLADDYTESLLNLSDYGAGWETWFSKFSEDLLTQDNGTMTEVIGPGKPDGPITGRALGVAHLDSWRCQRTRSKEFPIIYQDTDGKRYKMHYTRVIFTSQMPSPDALMYDVGMCAVSRCVNNAQSLLDMLVYKQEKLGSRPHRGLLITQGGLDPEDVRNAFFAAESTMDNQLLRRYSKTVVTGHENLPEANIQKIDLADLPDGFDEDSATTIGMAAIALAFGVDPRELWPAITGGVTRAEALIAHIKQRGKGLGSILQETERLLNQKFLPNTLDFEFDFQDDEQDRQIAEIRNTRARYWQTMLELGAIDSRTMREQQLSDGDISEEQFERLEARDGRLPEGTPILTLFNDPDFFDVLTVGVDNPLDRRVNDAANMLSTIDDLRNQIMFMMVGANPGEKKRLALALAALDQLAQLYGGQSEVMAQQERPTADEPKPEEGEEEDDFEDADEEVIEEDESDNLVELDDDDLELRSLSDTAYQAIKDAAKAIQESF